MPLETTQYTVCTDCADQPKIPLLVGEYWLEGQIVDRELFYVDCESCGIGCAQNTITKAKQTEVKA